MNEIFDFLLEGVKGLVADPKLLIMWALGFLLIYLGK